MEDYFEKPVLILNNLITDLKIGEVGFEKASSSTNVDKFKKLFKKIKEKNFEYYRRLEEEVKKYNGKLVSNRQSSNRIKLTNSVKKIENVSSENKNLNILEFCKELEYNIQIDFSNAVQADIPGETKDVIIEEYNQIRDFHDELNVLVEREVQGKKQGLRDKI